MYAARLPARSLLRSSATPARLFHSSRAAYIAVGDSVPSTLVQEGSPGNTVNLAKETASGKWVIIGVPGAFSPACSASHVPGYIKHFPELEKKGIKGVFVVAVNDSFVTKAWGEDLNTTDKVRIIADSNGELSKAFGTLFDAAKFFGNQRSKRFAAVVEDGKVIKEFVEPDNIGLEVSTVDSLLKNL